MFVTIPGWWGTNDSICFFGLGSNPPPHPSTPDPHPSSVSRRAIACHRLSLTAQVSIAEVDAKDFDLVVCAGGMPGAEHFRNSNVLNEIVPGGRTAAVHPDRRGRWLPPNPPAAG